jgi:hypothetical protein
VLNPPLFFVLVFVEDEEVGVLLLVLVAAALCVLVEVALLDVDDDVGAEELVVGELEAEELVVTASGVILI